MNKVTIIIGLSGSGKSVIANKRFEQRTSPIFYHADWGWEGSIDEEGNINGSFNDDNRFNKLLDQIKGGLDIILDGAYFCNHKFLCQAEYYLNLHFPNIEITKHYFENNPKDAIANVLFREWNGGKGNYWTKETGELIFHGHHYDKEGPNNGRRNYEVIIDNINSFTKQYIIPNKYTPIKIQVQDTRFYNGWKELIRN